jgi:hypothetical protein
MGKKDPSRGASRVILTHSGNSNLLILRCCSRSRRDIHAYEHKARDMAINLDRQCSVNYLI